LINFQDAPSHFLVALLIIAVGAITGPLFHFSDTSQLAINTGTSVTGMARRPN
jgi:low affinity Fe/Cu permease